MIDVMAALEEAQAVAAKQNVLTTVGDIKLLYPLYGMATAGTFDLKKIISAGKFPALVSAIAREAALLDALVKDPKQAGRIEALLESLL